jgi:hypothetical protein
MTNATSTGLCMAPVERADLLRALADLRAEIGQTFARLNRVEAAPTEKALIGDCSADRGHRQN